MCKDCGCSAEKNSQIKLYVKGYSDSNVKDIERSLLGLPGVLHVHIHAHDGLTTIDYNPAKTRIAEITQMMEGQGLHAVV
jgi:copper chaperone